MCGVFQATTALCKTDKQQNVWMRSPNSRPRNASATNVAARFPEHPRIITEGLHLADDDPFVVGMGGIDEPVVLARSESGRHHEQKMLSPLREFIAELG